MKFIRLLNHKKQLVGLACVSNSDYAELSQYHWSLNGRGYVQRASKNTKSGKPEPLLMHRQIMNPGKMQVDHRNGNRIDNTRENLRVCTPAQNGQNSGKRERNKSGYKGVSLWHGYWIAQIKKDGVGKHLGYFKSKEAAYAAYCKAALELHGEFAHV